MKKNNFKACLKANVPNIIDSSFYNCNDTNLLLLKLGLFPVSKNVQAELSDDNKYLNIKLKGSPEEKHLLFQFPLEETDLSAFKKRSDYQELLDRYYLYTNDYVDEIKKYAMQETEYLQKKFPGLVFSIKIRIKSPDSYSKKLNENILDGKSPYINDIIAERIILSQYTGNEKRNLLKETYANNKEILEQLYLEDEKELKKMCDEVAKALYEFRINTNFRMKKYIEPNEANSEKEYITKDYIKHPKENGYESIHILMEHKDNKDFTYETQIRTLRMESISKNSGEIAHTKYKPRLLNDLSPNKVPIYSEVTSFVDESGNPKIIDIPFENRFYHFYKFTYQKFRKEQYELERLLGLQFKQIRQRLREINSRRKEKQEVR